MEEMLEMEWDALARDQRSRSVSGTYENETLILRHAIN
jgi:hypothetical protein